MKTTLAALAVVALANTAAMAGSAQAAENDEQSEATALQGAKVTLTQAIATAEQRTGGRAFDAGVDVENRQVRIAVETNGHSGVQTVIIDAQSGQVVGTHAGGETD